MTDTTHNSPREAAYSPEVFQHLVQSVKEYAIFQLDPQGFIVTWNDGAEAIKGYKAEEIIGQHFSKFYLPEAVDRAWPARELELATQHGRFTDEGLRVKKDGSTFWASVSISAIHDSDGNLLGFTKVTRDLTDRRNAEERIQDLNRQLRARVEELDEAQHAVELRTMESQRLSGELLRAQDMERRRIARELHDDLGQLLSVLTLSLSSMAPNYPEAAPR